MDLAAPFRHQDKTSGTRGRIKAELKQELATAGSYRVLAKK
jgi:hypothetical protein